MQLAMQLLPFKRAAALFALALLVSLSALAQTALPKGFERSASVEGITEYRLPNGLRVLLFPDQSKQTITVNVTYLVGSKHENYGETGMAHLLEHLVFKGTPKHQKIPDELTEHGTRPNGSTWYDRTNYYETFQATEENLKWALDLESDRMINSYIAKKDLDSEMTVVRNELESGENDPFGVTLERIFSTAYLWHNYGKSTIGARADLENVPIDRLQAFYKTYYQPDNAVLLVAGKFDEAKTLELINQYFAPIPKPTRKLQTLYTQEPVQDGERQVIVRRVGDTQLVASAYRIPGGSHQDAAAASILMQVLADTPSGRLHKALVETKKASQVFNFPYIFGESSLLIVGAQVLKDASLDAAKDGLLQVVEDLAKTPVTKEEVERARGQLLKNIELRLNSSEEVGLEISEWLGVGDWRMLFINRDRLRKITAEEVQRAAVNYLKSTNRTLGMFIPTAKPERAEIPANPDVLALVKDYKGDAKVAEGEAFDPSPANVEARAVRAAAGGLKLALVPKKTRGGTVTALLNFRLGDEQSLMNRDIAGALVVDMLLRGTAKHTRQQIQDEFDKLKAKVGITGSPENATVSIETIRENLPAVLRLVTEALREPNFPASEFEQLRQEQIAGIEQQKSEPTALASTLFQRHLRPYPKGHVKYVSTPDEALADLKAVTLDQVKKFYADFYGAQNGEVAVVGDFDDKEVSKLLGDLLGNWKGKLPYAQIAEPFKDVAAVNQSLETPDKANAFFIAGQNLKLRYDDPDTPAVVLGNYMLGGGFLNSRLAARIRGKDGLSYGVGSQLQPATTGNNGLFVTFAIYAPQNAVKLEAAFKEEITKALKDGFTAEEVAAAKKGWLQSRQVSRAQDNELTARLNNVTFLGKTLAWEADFEKKVDALTPDQVVAALRKHLDLNKITIFKAGDFAKAAGK
jgi:zinc protease